MKPPKNLQKTERATNQNRFAIAHGMFF